MSSDNTAQIAFWNGEAGQRWADRQTRLDALIAPYGAMALAAAAARPGERVLDVGCGCGDTSLALADAVGPTGAVVGVDVSTPMLARARERAAGRPNLRFIEADAGAAELPGPFDLLFSRFGVMFFADPGAAFARMARALRPGARVAFVCWRGLADNPWALAPVVAAIRALGISPPPSDPYAPGPFAFADADRLRGLMSTAGYSDIDIAPREAPMLTGETLEEAARTSLEMGPAAALARESGVDPATLIAPLADALRPWAGPGGVTPPGAVWIVTARRM